MINHSLYRHCELIFTFCRTEPAEVLLKKKINEALLLRLLHSCLIRNDVNYFLILFISLVLATDLNAQSGPYPPPIGQFGSTAMFKDSSVFVSWATSAIIERGWQNIADTSLGKVTAGNDTSATDKSGINGVVSLGDGGSATLTFAGNIFDGPGADFAVFENSFDGLFLELAFVEVSSDGANFFRFDAISLTDTSVQIPSFGNLDATNLHNFAGKYIAQYGTPFDLNELSGISGLDINNITHIKVIDVIGNIANPFVNFDSQNNPINDPWTTAFPVGGFDLDAVGVINFNSVGVNEIRNNVISNLYPNPFKDVLTIDLKTLEKYTYNISDLSGKSVSNGLINDLKHQFDLSELKAGIYFLQVMSDTKFFVKKIIKE